MKGQNFKRRSYNLNEKETESKQNDLGSHAQNFKNKHRNLIEKWIFRKSVCEPELKQFVFETRSGETKRSTNYRSGWNIDEHRVPIDELYSRYEVHPDKGLSTPNIPRHREKYGTNVLSPVKKMAEWKKFLADVLLGLNLLLWISGVITLITAILQFATGDPSDGYQSLYSGMSLLTVVLVAGCFVYYQEYQSNRVMDSFKMMVPQFITALRDGSRRQVNTTDIVVGDIVEIKCGDKLPADIRLIECHSLKVDNSCLTGESEPQSREASYTNKNALESKNIAFFSTNVVQGFGRGIVIKVGDATLIGRLAKLASSAKAAHSPIAREMMMIVRLMVGISLFFGIIFYFVAISMHYTWVNAIYFVIGIVVGNVPENLSVTLTIILALVAKKMAKKNCLVKQLQAVETLGSATVICSDKTGTLTQNKMSVAHLWFNDIIAEADTTNFEREENENTKLAGYDYNDPGFLQLATVASLCSRAKFKQGQEGVPVLARETEGDSSEVAILRCMETQLGDVESFRENFPKVFEIPFNSFNKYQISIHEFRTKDSDYLLTMKGAPEKILYMCSTLALESLTVPLDTEMRNKVHAACEKLAALGERVLGFCDCRLPSELYPLGFPYDENTFNNIENVKGISLRFVGLMSLIDPPRSTVPTAVLKCKSAGIKVVMVTGDHPVTAAAIARAVNIISPETEVVQENEVLLRAHYCPTIMLPTNDVKNDQNSNIYDNEGMNANHSTLPPLAAVITGSLLTAMSLEDLQLVVSTYDQIVFARVTPEQKYDIVKAYQALGHVVAVTGDGVNDAPALKKANIGIAMGSGTEVAKEVANLILLDDNFSSIVGGVEDGRLIFENLKKLIRFTMSDNVAEMYCYWVYITLRVPLPMGTIGMLLSTLAADVFPAVSLAHESVESDVMKMKPRNAETDVLMSLPTLSYAYGQVGVIEMLAGFFNYLVVFGQNGWLPKHLLFCQDKFESSVVNDLKDSYGQEWNYKARMELEREAQTAFFLAIVVCQFANAICCKTRRFSVFQKGFSNKLMNVGLILMLCVPCIFIYTPGLNTVVSFAPLRLESWIAATPFAIFLFWYDELRRLLLRLRISPWINREFSA